MTTRIRGVLTDVKETLADLLTHVPIDGLREVERHHVTAAFGSLSLALDVQQPDDAESVAEKCRIARALTSDFVRLAEKLEVIPDAAHRDEAQG